MKIQKICVLGGTGFVGRHLVARLANRGYQVKVLTRHPQRHRDIAVLPGADLAEADIHDPTVLLENFSGCHAVINLVGILHEYPNQSFRAVHAELPAKIIDVYKRQSPNASVCRNRPDRFHPCCPCPRAGA